MMRNNTFPCRLPAEWEPQDAVLLAWPHSNTDWAEILPEVDKTYIALVNELVHLTKVIIATPEPDAVHNKLQTAAIPLSNILLFDIQTNDTWARDFGPITIEKAGGVILLDFGFNGWGLKFAADHDNQISKKLHQAGCFNNAQIQTKGLILEGGSIESDGCGTLLTTSECLLNPNRNPHLSQSELNDILSREFGCDHILWLDHGYLAGDDTDSHIDTLARLCPDNTIVYVECDDCDDEHYSALLHMKNQLKTFKTRDNKPFRLLPLPWPQAHFDGTDRLPATYANYLVTNGAVLVPTYNDPADKQALAIISEAFPERKIIGIDCRSLIKQHGSLHCITMQIPQGVMS